MKGFRAALVGLLVLLLSASLLAASQAASPTPAFVAKWGSDGGQLNQFGSPWGVALDSNGNVYVTEISNYRVQKFDSSGNFLSMWGWGVDTGANAAEVCTATCQTGISGSGDGQFEGPFGIAIDSSDHVYVLDSSSARVQKFDSSGNFITKWGSLGTAEGQFDSPRGMAIDDAGNLYVVDTNNARVQKFNSSGDFLRMWGWGVTDGSSVFQTCTATCQAGISGSGDGQFDSPSAIATDHIGHVYVSNLNGSKIQKFDSDGNFITKWGSLGSGDGQFNPPEGLATDSLGNVFASDYNGHRIEKFDSAGNYLSQWGSSGTGDGQFSLPQGIAISPSGLLYVAEGGNSRIQIFGPPATALTIKAPSSVRKGSIARVRGRLTSSDAACPIGRKVKLAKGTKTLARDKTSVTGAYSFKVRVRAKMTVKVTYAGGIECAPSTSAAKTIRVT